MVDDPQKVSTLGVNVLNLKSGARVLSATSFELPVQINKLLRWDTQINVGAYSLVHGPGEIVCAEIGRYCSIAPGVVIGANEHAIDWLSTSSLFESPSLLPLAERTRALTGRPFKGSVQRIKIGNDVWIGQNSFVRGGVTIGDGAVIGSMSNVIHDVDPYAIVAGNPARLIRYRFDHKTICRLLELEWWRFPLENILDADFQDVPKALDNLERALVSGQLNATSVRVVSMRDLFEAT